MISAEELNTMDYLKSEVFLSSPHIQPQRKILLLFIMWQDLLIYNKRDIPPLYS